MTNFLDKKIVIIGLGLIGGSIAKGLADKKICNNVWAVGRNQETLEQAKAEGAIQHYSTDIEAACQNSDLIIISVPSLTVEPILAKLTNIVQKNTVITDAASVKGTIVDAAIKVFGHLPSNFVPGHPIAGSEQSGFSASKVDLYKGKKVILTPSESTSSQALSMVVDLWESIDAEVLKMSVEKHDEVLAATSHLPHLLAFGLVDTLSQQGQSEEIFRYAAGGFRDFTRIASSDPQMWRDIFLANGDATIKILDQYTHELSTLRKALSEKDADTLMQTFERAKKSRDKFNNA